MLPLGALFWTLGAGIVVGAAATLSSLTLVAIALAAATVLFARRGLASDEAAWVTTLLVAGLAARALAIVLLNLASYATQNDQSAAILFGDEAYNLARAARTRDILFGLPVSKLDYQVMFDSYAQTGYMTFLTWLQVTFGSSPYAVRLLNGVLFTAGAALLYRVARTGFGVIPALVALGTVLFLPSLFLFSISLLKESIYFLLSAVMVVAVVRIAGGASWRVRVAWGMLFAVCVWAIADLRSGAAFLTGGALAAGAAVRWVLGSRRRAVVVGLALAVALLVLRRSTAMSDQLLGTLVMTAKQHTGHVFTVGHAYKTLDDAFYETVQTPLASTLTLTPGQAARYVARSLYAFVTVPFPWHVETRSEVVFIPEQIVWYLIVAGAAIGLRPAWRRDPLLAALLVAAIVPTAAIVALTSGNVGTLVRLRGLVTPFLVWLGALGGTLVLRRLAASQPADA